MSASCLARIGRALRERNFGVGLSISLFVRGVIFCVLDFVSVTSEACAFSVFDCGCFSVSLEGPSPDVGIGGCLRG